MCMAIPALPDVAVRQADPQSILLFQKYGITKVFADDVDDSDRPTPCTPATLAGMGADRG